MSNPGYGNAKSSPGFFLNPRFQYEEGFVYSDNIRSGVTKVIERLAPNVTFAIEATREIAQFRGKIGRFGDLTAQTAVGIMNPGNLRRLKELMQNKDNCACADCSAPDPKWASANIGVFICLKCCGVHRSLGTHISKVLSVTLDDWSDDEIDSMIEVGGNSSANAIYEAFLPEGFSKPRPNASHEERLNFIRSKYELQEFLKPSLRIISFSSGRSSVPNDSRRNMDVFLDSGRSKEVGMVEFIGCLKVKVVKGTNLAIRDIRTSDPYVVLELGQQRVQTKVIKSNLNPIWDEELMLSVPQYYGPVKLQVFDHDTFSADDIMGEAEIDIQPLITAAVAFEGAGISDMQIGKWLKSHDNALINDSIINIVDGRVKQEVSLQLQNVESGEVEIELEWIPLDQ